MADYTGHVEINQFSGGERSPNTGLTAKFVSFADASEYTLTETAAGSGIYENSAVPEGLYSLHDDRDGGLVVDSGETYFVGPVNTAGIADSAVTTVKIADDAVTKAKLSSNVESKIYDVFTSDRYANESITLQKLSQAVQKSINDPFTSSRYADGSVAKGKLSTTVQSILNAAISTGGVTNNPDDLTLETNVSDEIQIKSPYARALYKTSDESASKAGLATTIAKLSGSDGIVLLDSVVEMGVDYTIPSNVELQIENGAKFQGLSIVNSSYQWTASGSGTDEYYLEISGGGQPNDNDSNALTEPDKVYEDGTLLTIGTAGTLSAGEWDWADNDTLGYSTIYVRMNATGDPDGQSDDFLRAGYGLVLESLSAGYFEVFDEVGDLTFNQMQPVPSQWVGVFATGADETEVFKQACEYLIGSNALLILPEGTITLIDTNHTSPLVTLDGTFKMRGQGRGITIFDTSGFDGAIFQSSGSYTNSTTLGANVSENDMSVSVASDVASTFPAGTLVKLFSNDVSGNETGTGSATWYRSEHAVVQSASYSAPNTTINLSRGTVWSYTTGNSAVIKVFNAVEDCYFGHFTMNNSTSNNHPYGIRADYMANSLFENLEFNEFGEAGLWLRDAFNCRAINVDGFDNYNRDLGDPGASYGIGLSCCTDILISGVHLERNKHAIAIAGSSAEGNTHSIVNIRVVDSFLGGWDANASIDIHSGKNISYENCHVLGNVKFGNCSVSFKDCQIFEQGNQRQIMALRGDGADSWIDLEMDGNVIFTNSTFAGGKILSLLGDETGTYRGRILNTQIHVLENCVSDVLEIKDFDRITIDGFNVWNETGGDLGAGDIEDCVQVEFLNSVHRGGLNITNGDVVAEYIKIDGVTWLECSGYTPHIDGDDGAAGENIDEVIYTNCIALDNTNGIWIEDADNVRVQNNHIKKLDGAFTASEALIRLSDVAHALITGNYLEAGNNPVWYMNDNTVDSLIMNGNDINTSSGFGPFTQVTAKEVTNNIGWVTENNGTATLANGTTSIAVNHGLNVTPAAGDIVISPLESLGSASEFYVDTYTSTQFTIHVDVDPTADVDFAWFARSID